MALVSIRFLILVLLSLTGSLCTEWSKNLYIKTLKHVFPTNYSTDSVEAITKNKDIQFFPWIFIVPKLDGDYTWIEMQGYIVMHWSDFQMKKWNFSSLEWRGLREFPLTSFGGYPSIFPNIVGIDEDTITLYINSDGSITYLAKTMQYVDCYRLRESKYPKETFQCDYDWKLVNSDFKTLTCNIKFFKFNYSCNVYYNGTSFFTSYLENSVHLWNIRITHTYLNNPQRIRFTITLKRKNDDFMMTDYGPFIAVSIMIVLQMLIYPHYVERLVVGLLTLLDLLIGLVSLERLTAVRDDPSLKIMSYHQVLIIIQSVLLIQSILLYSLVSLNSNLPVPRFLCNIVNNLCGSCIRLRLHKDNNASFGYSKRRTDLEDYIIDKKTDEYSSEYISSRMQFEDGRGEPMNVGFYVDDRDPAIEVDITGKDHAKLSWTKLAWFLNTSTSLIILIFFLYFTVRYI